MAIKFPKVFSLWRVAGCRQVRELRRVGVRFAAIIGPPGVQNVQILALERKFWAILPRDTCYGRIGFSIRHTATCHKAVEPRSTLDVVTQSVVQGALI